MEHPDLRQIAYEYIDSHSESITGIIQIVIDGSGNVSTAIAGDPKILVKVLASEIKSSDTVKVMFKTALEIAEKAHSDPSMN